MFFAGSVESTNKDFVADTNNHEYLLAPFSYYRLDAKMFPVWSGTFSKAKFPDFIKTLTAISPIDETYYLVTNSLDLSTFDQEDRYRLIPLKKAGLVRAWRLNT